MRKLDKHKDLDGPRKDSRSISPSSSSSVSTISTNLSRSPSPSHEFPKTKHQPISIHAGLGKRRRRSTASSMTDTSESSVERLQPNRSSNGDRNTRRRRSSISPDIRGRGRSHQREIKKGRIHRSNWRQSSKSSSSYSSDQSLETKRSPDHDYHGYNTRFRSSISPVSQVRDKNFFGKRSNRRTRSRSYSRDRSRVARNRHSMTPAASPRRTSVLTEFSSMKSRGSRICTDSDHHGSIFKTFDRENSQASRSRQFSRQTPKERSLSPFSRRLALTQAMNIG